MHEHEYDDGGRLVRTVVTREQEWDDEQQELMIALAVYRSQLCPSGHFLPESSAKANEGKYRSRNLRCHACTAASQGFEAIKNNPHPNAVLLGAELKRG